MDGSFNLLNQENAKKDKQSNTLTFNYIQSTLIKIHLITQLKSCDQDCSVKGTICKNETFLDFLGCL